MGNRVNISFKDASIVNGTIAACGKAVTDTDYRPYFDLDSIEKKGKRKQAKAALDAYKEGFCNGVACIDALTKVLFKGNPIAEDPEVAGRAVSEFLLEVMAEYMDREFEILEW